MTLERAAAEANNLHLVHRQGHSSCSARTGSAEAARRAGNQAASKDVPINTAAAAK